jgi:hypothetical protein
MATRREKRRKRREERRAARRKRWEDPEHRDTVWERIMRVVDMVTAIAGR